MGFIPSLKNNLGRKHRGGVQLIRTVIFGLDFDYFNMAIHESLVLNIFWKQGQEQQLWFLPLYNHFEITKA